MIKPEVISYIKIERAKGTSDSAIRSNLLNNGWTEKDIAEGMSSLSESSTSNVPGSLTILSTELKEYQNKVKWNTFGVLLVVDLLIILVIRLFYGIWGVFGISIYTILIRILVIYLIASFSSHSTSKEDKTSTAVGKSVMKVIGTTVVVILVGTGILFASCLFLFLGSHT